MTAYMYAYSNKDRSIFHVILIQNGQITCVECGTYDEMVDLITLLDKGNNNIANVTEYQIT